MSLPSAAMTAPNANSALLERFTQCDTPCHIVDATVVERNIQRMSEYCREHGLKLRPHTKTHKSRLIARMQLAAGASGRTVAKPGDTRVMASLDAEVLIAYPAVTDASLHAIRELSADTSFLVALDSREAIHRLENSQASNSPPVRVLVEVDVGLHRTGVQTPDESVELAQRVASSGRLRADGPNFSPP